ncbi:hypothetical protein CAOG_04660 [Capsaspora owczarzaki ATCC 30864]|uniref:Uncharacterized protein n=1 Tax=Capsaspora owczarzaki (strain ATCC 30864) TaxID=595528 RepID=A0A0D2UFN8_CAPO3|nr:hypothetical protein CAOG_04660 [Capsaspora owczarzaki ATCC 30864]KJE93951.1 hypothetical protein CAOG_004660 [Capsaspora owczarzaki ATCC 30864]|eukprot:XP_004347407.2 hypothetical protein CAOG_04660 [Capsaspora owczarzaki ATCC 30864]
MQPKILVVGQTLSALAVTASLRSRGCHVLRARTRDNPTMTTTTEGRPGHALVLTPAAPMLKIVQEIRNAKDAHKHQALSDTSICEILTGGGESFSFRGHRITAIESELLAVVDRQRLASMLQEQCHGVQEVQMDHIDPSQFDLVVHTTGSFHRSESKALRPGMTMVAGVIPPGRFSEHEAARICPPRTLRVWGFDATVVAMVQDGQGTIQWHSLLPLHDAPLAAQINDAAQRSLNYLHDSVFSGLWDDRIRAAISATPSSQFLTRSLSADPVHVHMQPPGTSSKASSNPILSVSLGRAAVEYPPLGIQPLLHTFKAAVSLATTVANSSLDMLRPNIARYVATQTQQTAALVRRGERFATILQHAEDTEISLEYSFVTSMAY